MLIYSGIWFFIMLIAPATTAQNITRYNTFSYNVNEGLLQSTMSDMAFDKNNFCWISFPNGIQRFDGNSFSMVPIQPGLPDDKFVQFLQCKNGDLYISHTKGISKYEISNNRFIQVYTHEAEIKRADFIGEDGPVIYWYTFSGLIIGLDRSTGKLVSKVKTGFPGTTDKNDYRPGISNIVDHKVALLSRTKLYLWDLQKAGVISQSDSVPAISPYFLWLRTGNEVLYNTYLVNTAIFSYTFSTKQTTILPVQGKNDEVISRCWIFPWGNRVLIAFNNHIYNTDTSFRVLRSEIVNFQNLPVADISGIARLKEDNFGNLYVWTITGGIRKIIRNNYPLKYYGTQSKEYNNVLAVLPDKKNNRILVGTARNGLQVFDTLQHLMKHIKALPGRDGFFSPNVIIKDNKDDYWLLCVGEKNAWKLSADLSRMMPVPINFPYSEKRGTEYFGNPLYQDEKMAIIQSQRVVYRIDFAANTITAKKFNESYTMSGLLYKNSIISHSNDELIYLDAATFTELKKVPFKNTGFVRCFAKDAAGSIYVGTNNGLFTIDSTGKILSHLTKANGLPDDCIYAMIHDDEGFTWCSSNKGIFKVKANSRILQLKKDDGLQENEFNTNVAARAEDGEFFFGGMNGVSSFYPAAISSFEEKINLLVTRIKINNVETFTDTAVWNIDKIDLPYDQNSLSFDFIAMANNNPGQYVYQYQMEGIDKEWIQNNDLQAIRYLLPTGSYSLRLYAGRSFNKDAIPMKEIRIIIRPPFWKTWWFITLMILLLVAALVYGINSYNKRKYQKKLMELENEHRIQLERERISRDLHDSIGAYANAVLYNTELLQKEEDATERNELMDDLKFASKDIITSLRETIWALKKDNYTAEDCLFRIKNFIQSLARYYPHIQFTNEGEAPIDKELHYTKALNVVRIVQEAVTNAIKHAAPGNIKITSAEIDGRWQLEIINDGNVFNYEALKKEEQGNGLGNMKQRAADSGFKISIESNNNTGTRISILV